MKRTCDTHETSALFVHSCMFLKGDKGTIILGSPTSLTLYYISGDKFENFAYPSKSEISWEEISAHFNGRITLSRVCRHVEKCTSGIIVSCLYFNSIIVPPLGLA